MGLWNCAFPGNAVHFCRRCTARKNITRRRRRRQRSIDLFFQDGRIEITTAEKLPQKCGRGKFEGALWVGWSVAGFYGVFRQWKMQEIQLGFGLFLMFCIQGESISLKCWFSDWRLVSTFSKTCIGDLNRVQGWSKDDWVPTWRRTSQQLWTVLPCILDSGFFGMGGQCYTATPAKLKTGPILTNIMF